MAIAASIVVAVVLTVWAGLVLWSAARQAAVRRHRPPPRTPGSAPTGLAPVSREPEALRGPFAFVLRGRILDVVPAFAGNVGGHELAVTDVTARHAHGGEVRHHTVVTVDVAYRWPWMRVRRVGLDVPVVSHDPLAPPVDEEGQWVCEAADHDLARTWVTPSLLEQLATVAAPLQLETTPRHLLVAGEGRLDGADLAALVAVALAAIELAPPALLAAATPPSPADEV